MLGPQCARNRATHCASSLRACQFAKGGGTCARTSRHCPTGTHATTAAVASAGVAAVVVPRGSHLHGMHQLHHRGDQSSGKHNTHSRLAGTVKARDAAMLPAEEIGPEDATRVTRARNRNSSNQHRSLLTCTQRLLVLVGGGVRGGAAPPAQGPMTATGSCSTCSATSAYRHTGTRTRMHTGKHAGSHAGRHARTNVHKHVGMQARMHAGRQAGRHARTDART